jgi:hypothetical protein
MRLLGLNYTIDAVRHVTKYLVTSLGYSMPCAMSRSISSLHLDTVHLNTVSQPSKHTYYLVVQFMTFK